MQRANKISEPYISIVMVHYKDLQISQICIDSIKAQLYKYFELIIVDNSANQESRMLDLKGVDRFYLITDKVNYGYAKACNIGIKRSKGEYILVLNNDLELDKGFLNELTKALTIKSDIGMYAPKIFLAETDGLLDSAGMKIYLDGLAKQRGHLENGRLKYAVQEEVLFPSGCAALYKKTMLAEIGLFDEDFFLYCEDTDLGLRAQLAGWRCLFVPDALAYHKYSASSSPYSSLKAFYVERNRLFVVIKNFNLALLINSLIYTLIRYAFQFVNILKRRGMTGEYVKQVSFYGLIVVFVRAYLSALIYLPKMLKKRWSNGKIKKISNMKLYEIIKTNSILIKELASEI